MQTIDLYLILICFYFCFLLICYLIHALLNDSILFPTKIKFHNKIRICQLHLIFPSSLIISLWEAA